VAPERTDIVQLPYNGDALQQWILIPTATGGFLFKNKGNGLYMSPPESRLHEGTGLFTHPRRNNDSEVWRIVPARP
ncbi:MAG TPA: RICIN domain-containing protein, partial [Thermoguttaceae bacterium]|nr:RICIN domain-containing protein [Thermoguttaceae bacterium]